MARIIVHKGGRIVASYNREDGVYVGAGGHLDADAIEASHNDGHGLNVQGDGQAAFRELGATGNGGRGVNVQDVAEEMQHLVDWNGEAPSIDALEPFIRELGEGQREETPEATIKAAAARVGLLSFLSDRSISLTALATSLGLLFGHQHAAAHRH